MKRNYSRQIRILHKAAIFQNVPAEEFDDMLEALDSQLKYYRSNQILISQGTKTSRAGVLLEGSLLQYQEDFWGRRSEIHEIKEGQLFLESSACARSTVSLSTVQAQTASTVLWFNMNDIMRLDGSRRFHTILVRNLMHVFAEKNLELNEKLVHMEKRSTKEKLLSYFSQQSVEHHSDSFDLDLTRAQLAEYLCVDRAAMSSELTKLKKDGYLEAERNHIRLLRPVR